MIRALCLLLTMSAPLSAQSIPMPFAQDSEARQISVVVTPGRKSMRGLPGDLREARRKMLARQVVSDRDLRRLAQRGDGLAAQKYVRLLTGRGEAISAASDVAYYAAIAVGTGRIWTLRDMVAAMQHLDPETEPKARIRKHIQVLYPHAWAGNSVALQAVADFNGEGRLFGALSDTTRDKILAESRETGDGRVPLGMALAILERGALTQTQHTEARRLLDSARQTTHPGIKAAAEALLRQMDEKQAEAG